MTLPAKQCFVAILVVGCAPTLVVPSEGDGDAGASGLLLDPPGCCEVASGFRFSFEAPAYAPFPLMFSGELSDYHRSRLDGDALSSTLLERRIDLGREDRDGASWFAPLDALEVGALYSIALSETATFVVEVEKGDDAAFVRTWPRDAEPTRLAVYCSEELARGASVSLPDGLVPLVVPGNNRCFGLLAEPGVEPVFSPRELFGGTLQTTVLSGVVSSARGPERLDCGDEESRFVVGCARVEDDRLHFRSPSDSYWMIDGAASLSVASGAGDVATLSGLPSDRRFNVSVRVFLRDGTELRANLTIQTAEGRPHVVINEILSDPTGPEPQQEWIELYNDGADAVDLSGYRLVDRTFEEAAELPSASIAPGEFLILARDDYDATLGWDLAPEASTRVLRVPELGAYGLSNSGEPLSLYAPSGQVVSRVPPLGARTGFSLARRAPSCPDAPECFGVHADPGASPGAENVVEAER